MVLFSFIAGILVGAAASRVALPMWRAASAHVGHRRRYLVALGFVAAFALTAGIIYLAIGSRHSLEPGAMSRALPPAPAGASAGVGSTTAAGSPAKSMQNAVAGLEARLAREGGSPADWALLAHAYDFLGRPDDARRARGKAGNATADTAIPRPGPGAWQEMADALAAAPAAGSNGAAGRTATPASVGDGAARPLGSAVELERRVAVNPRDAQSWLALADQRRSQRDYAGARNAYQKLVDLGAMSAQSWADYADVLGSLAGGGTLTGDAGRAIDNALASDPRNPKALWLKASQAHELRRDGEALGWWKKLRAVLPQDSPDARVVDANITEASTLAAEERVPATAVAIATATATTAEVSGTVTLDQRFTNRVQSDATLFIYAKAADSPGPPLAVLRTTVSAWPVRFRLDDSMAMIPSRRLSQFERVVIEARISRSGQAMPARGDLYVTSAVLDPASGTRLALVINREIG